MAVVLIALYVILTGYIYAGTGGGVYRSTDIGSTWSFVGLRNKNISVIEINSLDYLFAGSDGFGIFRSTDDGITWTQTKTGLPASGISDIVVDTNDQIYAACYRPAFSLPNDTIPGIYSSIDNGEHWNRIYTGDIYKLGISQVGNIWSVSYSGITISTNQGITWNNLGVSFPHVNSFLFHPSGNILIGADNNGPTGSFGPGLFLSSDTGADWNQILQENIYCFGTTASGDIYAGTDSGLIRSTNNGISWVYTNPQSPKICFTSITILPSSKIITGNYNGIFLSTDIGSSWSSSNTGLAAVSIGCLSGSSDGFIYSGSCGRIFSTNDNGATWNPPKIDFGNCNFSAIVVNTSRYIFAATYGGPGDDSGRVFVSLDTGKTWSQSGTMNTYFSALVTNKAGDVFAASVTGIFRTTDNGSAWSPTNEGLPYYEDLSGFRFYNVNSLVIDSSSTIFAVLEAYGIYRSTDNGNTWTAINGDMTLNKNFYSLAVTDTGILYVSTTAYAVTGYANPGVYRSSNNGNTWKYTNLRVDADISLCTNKAGDIFAGVSFQDQMDIPDYAADSNGVYLSTDNGNSWNQVNSGGLSSQDVNTLYLSPSGYLFAGTSANGVYRSKQQVTSVQNKLNKTPTSYSLYQNYPNPFNPSTQIAFSIPQSSYVTLKVYNLIGKEVATLVNSKKEIGTYTITWHARECASGIYFYRLVVGSYTITKKLVLLK